MNFPFCSFRDREYRFLLSLFSSNKALEIKGVWSKHFNFPSVILSICRNSWKAPANNFVFSYCCKLVFFKNFRKKPFKTPTFQNTFCWLLSLHWKNNRKKIKVFASYFFNFQLLFSMKIRIKESGTLCLWRTEMERSVFIKTEGTFRKFCFWLSRSNIWQKQKQKI